MAKGSAGVIKKRECIMVMIDTNTKECFTFNHTDCDVVELHGDIEIRRTKDGDKAIVLNATFVMKK